MGWAPSSPSSPSSPRSPKRESRLVTEQRENQEKLQAALKKVFDAYDVDESGSVSAQNFLKLEIRHGFQLGQISRIFAAWPQITRSDKASGGQLHFQEFCECRLRAYQRGQRVAWIPTPQKLAQCALEEAELTLLERARMGPRYHPGIRSLLKELFIECNVAQNQRLSPSEWMSTNCFLAVDDAGCATVLHSWLGAVAFQKADSEQNGFLRRDDFLNHSFDVLEERFVRDTDGALRATQDTFQKLQLREPSERLLCSPVAIHAQALTEPDFQPPGQARRTNNFAAFTFTGYVQMAMAMSTIGQLMNLLRLHLRLPENTWFSAFWHHPQLHEARPPVFLANMSDARIMLESVLTRPDGHVIFVKNIRPSPKNLEVQIPQNLDDRSLEDRVERIAMTGKRWGIDWETQLAGAGCHLPIFSSDQGFMVGDVLAVRVPESANMKHNMPFSIYMDQPGVLIGPFLETSGITAESEANKAARRGAGRAGQPKQTASARGRGRQGDKGAASILYFVAQREGTCRLFVEVSWEAAEEEVARQPAFLNHCECPAAEASVGRIGPLALQVRGKEDHHHGHPSSSRGPSESWLWWNGLKWSPKRGRVSTRRPCSEKREVAAPLQVEMSTVLQPGSPGKGLTIRQMPCLTPKGGSRGPHDAPTGVSGAAGAQSSAEREEAGSLAPSGPNGQQAAVGTEQLSAGGPDGMADSQRQAFGHVDTNSSQDYASVQPEQGREQSFGRTLALADEDVQNSELSFTHQKSVVPAWQADEPSKLDVEGGDANAFAGACSPSAISTPRGAGRGTVTAHRLFHGGARGTKGSKSDTNDPDEPERPRSARGARSNVQGAGDAWGTGKGPQRPGSARAKGSGASDDNASAKNSDSSVNEALDAVTGDVPDAARPRPPSGKRPSSAKRPSGAARPSSASSRPSSARKSVPGPPPSPMKTTGSSQASRVNELRTI